MSREMKLNKKYISRRWKIKVNSLRKSVQRNVCNVHTSDRDTEKIIQSSSVKNLFYLNIESLFKFVFFKFMLYLLFLLRVYKKIPRLL